MDFGIWLKRTMAERHLAGRDLAGKLRVSDSAVSRWISGDQLPSMRVLSRMATVLEVEPLSLYVRAGRLTEEETGVPPAPMPPPQVDREEFERTIRGKVPGVSNKSVMRLMEAYDEIMEIEENR